MAAIDKSTGSNMIVIGGPLIEVAKALHELVEAFRDITGLIGDGVNLLRRHRAGGTADNLHNLSFRAGGGFMAPLLRIADGEGSTEDANQLDKLLRNSAEMVSDKVAALAKYEAVVRRDLGEAAVPEFMGLIHDSGGKFVIRWEIEGLVFLVRDGKALNRQKAQAERVIVMIEEFNQRLSKLHDRIYPPRGAPV